MYIHNTHVIVFDFLTGEDDPDYSEDFELYDSLQDQPVIDLHEKPSKSSSTLDQKDSAIKMDVKMDVDRDADDEEEFDYDKVTAMFGKSVYDSNFCLNVHSDGQVKFEGFTGHKLQ